MIDFVTMSIDENTQIGYRDTRGRFTKGWKGGGRKLGSRQKIAEDFLADSMPFGRSMG